MFSIMIFTLFARAEQISNIFHNQPDSYDIMEEFDKTISYNRIIKIALKSYNNHNKNYLDDFSHLNDSKEKYKKMLKTYNHTLNDLVFLQFEPKNNILIISFRGTKMGVDEWMVNFKSQPTSLSNLEIYKDYPFLQLNGLIHKGFSDLLDVVFSHVVHDIQDCLNYVHPNLLKIFIVGHSRGGALSLLFHFFIAQVVQHFNWQAKVYTLAISAPNPLYANIQDVSSQDDQNTHYNDEDSTNSFSLKNILKYSQQYIWKKFVRLNNSAPEVQEATNFVRRIVDPHSILQIWHHYDAVPYSTNLGGPMVGTFAISFPGYYYEDIRSVEVLKRIARRNDLDSNKKFQKISSKEKASYFHYVDPESSFSKELVPTYEQVLVNLHYKK